MLTIERNIRELAQQLAAQDQNLDGYRRGCAQIEEEINERDTYAQGVDFRFNVVDNLIHGEMSAGRDQLRALERIVSEMQGGVGVPDIFNIGPPGGGGTPQHVQQGEQDMNQVFRTNPGLHPTEPRRPAWQPATPERQNARTAHRQGPGRWQKSSHPSRSATRKASGGALPLLW